MSGGRPVLRPIGVALRELREELGVSQRRAATLIGLLNRQRTTKEDAA